jgi:L-methionine (R)-S-oxide reductase
MAEVTLDLRGVPKSEAYSELAKHIDAVLEGIDDEIAEMATVSSLVHNAFGFLWTGFYRVVTPGSLMRVGPYQGTLGCLEIAFGRGVCGTAAAERRAVIVHDVNQFPDHIACDASSRSEIVLPVTNASGDLIAVFDVDSERVGTFDADDERGLTAILARFSRRGASDDVRRRETL